MGFENENCGFNNGFLNNGFLNNEFFNGFNGLNANALASNIFENFPIQFNNCNFPDGFGKGYTATATFECDGDKSPKIVKKAYKHDIDNGKFKSKEVKDFPIKFFSLWDGDLPAKELHDNWANNWDNFNYKKQKSKKKSKSHKKCSGDKCVKD